MLSAALLSLMCYRLCFGVGSQQNTLFVVYLGLAGSFYFLVAGFVYFIKLYRVSRFTSFIQDLWPSPLTAFCLIEAGLLAGLFWLSHSCPVIDPDTYKGGSGLGAAGSARVVEVQGFYLTLTFVPSMEPETGHLRGYVVALKVICVVAQLSSILKALYINEFTFIAFLNIQDLAFNAFLQEAWYPESYAATTSLAWGLVEAGREACLVTIVQKVIGLCVFILLDPLGSGWY